MKVAWIDGLLKSKEYRYVHFHLNNQKAERKWFRKSRRNKQEGVPKKETHTQAMLTLADPELAIHAKYFESIYTLESELAETRKLKVHISENFDEYIESELKITEEAKYENIDLLKAELKDLESQAKEVEIFTPKPIEENHED